MTKQEEDKKDTAPEKVTLRNPDIRGVSLIQADNTSLFLGPKQRVKLDKEQVSKSIRDQIKSGLVQEE